MQENLLLIILFLPLIGSFFIAASKNDSSALNNSTNVAIFTILSNIFLILKLFSTMDIHTDSLQFMYNYTWQVIPQMNIVFGVDIIALLLLLTIHIVLLVAIFGMQKATNNQKTLLFFAMLFLTAFNGFFAAADIFSFYVFFALMPVPLFMQIGMVSGEKGLRSVLRFFIYCFIGASLLLVAAMLVYSSEGHNILIGEISEINFPDNRGIWIAGAVFIAFISRIPVWPFHYWITSLNSTIRNPLVFTCANLMPTAGLYGFLRFWPENVPEEISSLAPVFEFFCILTMLFIAIKGYSGTNLKDKLFSYIVVYYLLYLLAVFLPTDILQRNVAYSLFAFLLVVAVLIMIVAHVERESTKLLGATGGILCLQPRSSFAYSMLLLAAVGLPVSSLFWNNFIIISKIFDMSVYIGSAVMLTLIVAAVSLLQNLYLLKDKSCLLPGEEKIFDIDKIQFFVCYVIMAVLFLSFIKPLWFVL